MTALDLFNYFVNNVKDAFIFVCIAFPVALMVRAFFKK